MQYHTPTGIDLPVLQKLDRKIQTLINKILSEKIDEISVSTFIVEGSQLFTNEKKYKGNGEWYPVELAGNKLISYLYINYHDLYLQIYEHLN